MQWRSERGSAVAEFTMVAGLLTLLVLSVMQLALGLYVRNMLQDAASEGARYAALAGNTPTAGVARTEALIDAALGESYASTVSVSYGSVGGIPTAQVTVRGQLPLLGLLGPTTLEVRGHAAVETVP